MLSVRLARLVCSVSGGVDEALLLHACLLGLNSGVVALVLEILSELRSDEVGRGTGGDVVSVDGSGQLELGPLSVHFLF